MVGNNAANEDLIRFVERIENLIEERAAINDDIKDIKVEAKAKGFDNRTIMDVIRVRKLGKEVYEERKSLLDTYLAAFGIE